MPIQRASYIDEPLNDGMMAYGTVQVVRDEQKRQTGREFVAIGELWFAYKSISDYDISIYPSLASAEDIKIKTYYIHEVQDGLKVQINGETYDITGTNADDSRKYRYWLLKRVKA
jgi:SPP1 family predicted phage head-tail adaptor